MYHNLEVINLKERKIIYKNAKKIRIRNFTIMICFLIFPLSLIMGFSIADYASFKDTIAVFTNPIYPPYSETGNIVFTNGQSYYIEDKDDLEFISPVKSYETEIVDNKITFTVYSNGIINAAEQGIVTDCGTDKNGVKFIKITHPNSITTTYLNLTNIGVKVGDAVLKGKEIGTIKENEKLLLIINQDNDIVKNITINNNVILWEN